MTKDTHFLDGAVSQLFFRKKKWGFGVKGGGEVGPHEAGLRAKRGPYRHHPKSYASAGPYLRSSAFGN